MSDYVLALKELAATCNFREFLEQELRDRLVRGPQSEATKDVAWKTAQDIALAMEIIVLVIDR